MSEMIGFALEFVMMILFFIAIAILGLILYGFYWLGKFLYQKLKKYRRSIALND